MRRYGVWGGNPHGHSGVGMTPVATAYAVGASGRRAVGGGVGLGLTTIRAD